MICIGTFYSCVRIRLIDNSNARDVRLLSASSNEGEVRRKVIDLLESYRSKVIDQQLVKCKKSSQYSCHGRLARHPTMQYPVVTENDYWVLADAK